MTSEKLHLLLKLVIILSAHISFQVQRPVTVVLFLIRQRMTEVIFPQEQTLTFQVTVKRVIPMTTQRQGKLISSDSGSGRAHRMMCIQI